MELSQLPTLNASLNGLATVLLVTGFLCIRARKIEAHRACMVAALACSVLFLVSYLTYHYQVGTTRFQGTGWVRVLYFGVLATHTPLAAAVPVLALITLVRALRRRFDRHVAIARWTLPIWLYVSITGVVIYVMLYRLDFS